LEKGKLEEHRRHCGNCGAQVTPQASFCPSCGERLVPAGSHLSLVEDGPAETAVPADVPADNSVHETSHEVPAIEGGDSDIQRHTLDLLAAYNETLDLYDRLPQVVWVRKSQGFVGRFLLVPRWRLPLRYFLAHHVATTLTLLKRQFYADTAISGDSEVNRVERDVVENFQQTLPPIPYKRLVVGLFGPVFLLASLVLGAEQDAILNLVPPAALEVTTNPFNAANSDAVLDLADEASRKPGAAFTVALTLLILFWMALTVVASGFRLKRMLFNLYPLETDSLLSTSDADHRVNSEGIYALEARLFAKLGMNLPYEPPFDLLVGVPIRILSFLGSVAVILMGIILLVAGGIEGEAALQIVFYVLAVLLILVGLTVLVGSGVALVRSALTWRRRKAGLRELWDAID